MCQYANQDSVIMGIEIKLTGNKIVDLTFAFSLKIITFTGYSKKKENLQ